VDVKEIVRLEDEQLEESAGHRPPLTPTHNVKVRQLVGVLREKC
jgi:hypothetical protein